MNALAPNLPHHLWKPGVSGNPLGYTKPMRTAQEMAREHAEAAIATLKRNLDSPNVAGANQAAQILLDRAFGKAPERIEMSVGIFDSMQGNSRATIESVCAMLATGEAGELAKLLAQLQAAVNANAAPVIEAKPVTTTPPAPSTP